jgi:membrane protease YdiL (CAAX protease family)
MWFTGAILLVILGYVWIVEPYATRSYVTIPAAIVVLLSLWHAFRTKEWGFSRQAFLPGLAATAAFTLPLVIAVLAIGASLGTLHDRRDFLGSLAPLIPWGGAQQWVLQTVVLRDVQRGLSRRAGLVIAPLLFAAIHLPNPILTALTLVGAIGWCAIYNRYPNVIPLALSHALGTLTMLYAFDDRLTGGLRIGYRYLATL